MYCIALLVSQYQDKNQLGKEFNYPTPTGRDSGGGAGGVGWVGWEGGGGVSSKRNKSMLTSWTE